MGDNYRDAIRKSRKAGKNSSVSRAIAWSASKARAKVRAQHARESFHRRGADREAPEAPAQGRLV